jgi:antitoxin component YwqK of YwqJK toxin-antitoxin module
MSSLEIIKNGIYEFFDEKENIKYEQYYNNNKLIYTFKNDRILYCSENILGVKREKYNIFGIFAYSIILTLSISDKIIIDNYTDGVIASIKIYKNNLLNEVYRTYYSDGNIKEKIFYINGKKEGDYIIYYENGDIKYICNYRNDFKDGIQKTYYENKQLESEIEYVYNKEFKESFVNGIHQSYYETGELKSIAKIIYKNRNENGFIRTYYKNGNLEFEKYVINGFTTDSRDWYESGQIKKQCYYKNGLLYCLKTWYDNGNKKSLTYTNVKKIEIKLHQQWDLNGNKIIKN